MHRIIPKCIQYQHAQNYIIAKYICVRYLVTKWIEEYLCVFMCIDQLVFVCVDLLGQLSVLVGVGLVK